MGYIGLALSDLSKALEYDHDNTAVYFYKSLCYLKGNEYDKSVTELSILVSLNPNHRSGFYNLGFSFEKLGEIEKACQAYKTAARLGHFDAGIKSKQICQ